MIINAVNKFNKPYIGKIKIKIIFRNLIEVSKEILVQSLTTLGKELSMHSTI